MNLLDVLPQSTAVDFFQGYPRLVGGNVFAVNREYFVGVAVAGAVYIVTGGVIGLVLLLVTFGSCCCCDGSPVFSSHKWNRTAGRRRAGVVLSGGMTVVAQGMLALVVITFSALSLTVNQMRDVLQFAWRGVGGLVNYGADVVLTLQQIIAAFPEDFISDKYKPDFKNLQNELSSSLPDVNNARNVIQGYVNLAENIATRVDDAKSIVVVVVAVILLVFAFCMALSYYGTAEKKFVRIGVRILLLYPVLMSWLLMGVSISTGVVTGDACRVLDEYHQYLIAVSKGSSPQYTGDNILVTSGFNCPTQMYPQEIRQLNTSLGLLSKYPGVAALILNSSEPKIYRATASLTVNGSLSLTLARSILTTDLA